MEDIRNTQGRIHSLQSMGTVDGPGVRFVAFLSGCPLRCKCCHNPDTWDMMSGHEISATELVDKAERCRAYFGEKGGITLSGGEPLCQSEFALAVFKLCKEKNINTCLDTSGIYLNESIEEMLEFCDRVLLDIKYTSDELYKENVSEFSSLSAVLEFLSYLNKKGIPVTLRQVVIPSINDTSENFNALKKIALNFPCVDSVELLPFRKICKVKYDEMGIVFPFEDIPEGNAEQIKKVEEELNFQLFSADVKNV